MANIIGELLLAMISAFIRGLANSFFLMQIVLKVGAWLDTKVHGRTKIVVGLLLGVAAYFFVPIIAGLLTY
jgi:hypothetical protein